MIKKIKESRKDNKVLSNYIYLLLIQGTNFILPLITFPYLVRTLHLEKYGVVMMAGSLMVFMNIFVDFGFNISATREVSIIRNDKKKLSAFYWNVFYTKLILLFISFIILYLLTLIVPKLQSERQVFLLSFGVVIGQNIFPAWFFQGIEKMKVITLMNVLAKIIFAIAIFLFIKLPAQYIFVPVLNSLGFLIAGTLGFLISLRYIHYIKPQKSVMKSFFGENKSLIASNFATSIYTSGNTFILGLIGGDEMAGIYSSMEKLVMAFKTLYTPLYQAMFPWLASKPKEKIIQFIEYLKKPVALSGLLIFLLIFIFANLILNIVYNNKVITSYSNVFRILGLIAFFAALNMMYVSLAFPALKKYNYRMIPMVTGGVINFILAVAGAYLFGIYGVAVAVVLAELSILLMANYYFKKL